ncbi:helix-turn-helix transcriptional regulator [Mycolicibacterium llatzerense]|uniref:helix-turn-helix transcriptional regulator n=1 Tax=Mycolicibacterium llatzerense TaxID=280871 RepID=UPI0009F1841E|nr:LuxR C-terminal-related transcriptional regulator [Mycolicibacterium llatzerense]
MTDTGDPSESIRCVCQCEQGSPQRKDHRRPALSERETKVVRIWLRCDSKESVAAQLSISQNTVRKHIERVRSKYIAVGRPVPTKTDLLIRVLRDGIVDLDELEREIDAETAESPRQW